jgi:hypothetical protein
MDIAVLRGDFLDGNAAEEKEKRPAALRKAGR